MSISTIRSKLFQVFSAISHNNCPVCSSCLNYDNQNDSVYISCLNTYEHFEVSGFKDLNTGEFILIYLNNHTEGIVDASILQEFQKVIYRKLYSK